MRINKKERVNVKRYMEEMRANRTNRSYASIQGRNRQSAEDGFAEKHLTSKQSLYGMENEYARQRSPVPQGLRYNLESNMSNMRNVQPIQPMQPMPTMQPIYASYMPPMALNDFSMTQQSQVYASPPSYHQHNGMMNYSQTYNPHVQNYQPVHQELRYDYNYAAESNHGIGHPQNMPSKIQEENTRSPKRESTFTNFMKNDENVTKKKDSCVEEKRAETIEKIEVENLKKRSLSLEVIQTTEIEPAMQKKKKKRVYKKRETKELTQNNDAAEEKDLDFPEDNKLNVCKKFNEMVSLEKKKIEKRMSQDAKLKDILRSFNDKISAIADNYFSAQVVNNLTAFERKMAQFARERVESVDDGFSKKLLYFESSFMQQLAS